VPRIHELRVDSKKHMERELKTACESLIATQTQQLIGALLAFFNKVSVCVCGKAARENSCGVEVLIMGLSVYMCRFQCWSPKGSSPPTLSRADSSFWPSFTQ
jgi:hypothetical protein